jgi:serine/threonine-protein kinase
MEVVGTNSMDVGKISVVYLLLISLLLSACGQQQAINPTAPLMSASTPVTIVPTITPVPTFTPIPPTPTPGIGSTMVDKDGMILLYVPAGEFTMGSDKGEANERPVHTVYLDAFWIDRTEVTNKQYRACVSTGVCEPPSSNISALQQSSCYGKSCLYPFDYYGVVEFDDYPVIYVNWNQAKAYCSWAGRDLPSEAQWEKAARGTDARIYPWGNTEPNGSLLNYNSIIGDTTKVGSYLEGKSFYGAYDMAGNVWEWVNDWYGGSYYQSSPTVNPLGPDSGDGRVLRGRSLGSYGGYSVRASYRYWGYPTDSSHGDVGFRCALGTSQ